MLVMSDYSKAYLTYRKYKAKYLAKQQEMMTGGEVSEKKIKKKCKPGTTRGCHYVVKTRRCDYTSKTYPKNSKQDPRDTCICTYDTKRCVKKSGKRGLETRKINLDKMITKSIIEAIKKDKIASSQPSKKIAPSNALANLMAKRVGPGPPISKKVKASPNVANLLANKFGPPKVNIPSGLEGMLGQKFGLPKPPPQPTPSQVGPDKDAILEKFKRFQRLRLPPGAIQIKIQEDMDQLNIDSPEYKILEEFKTSLDESPEKIAREKKEAMMSQFRGDNLGHLQKLFTQREEDKITNKPFDSKEEIYTKMVSFITDGIKEKKLAESDQEELETKARGIFTSVDDSEKDQINIKTSNNQLIDAMVNTLETDKDTKIKLKKWYQEHLPESAKGDIIHQKDFIKWYVLNMLLDQYLLQVYNKGRELSDIKDKRLIDKKNLVALRPTVARLFKKDEIQEIGSSYDVPPAFTKDMECRAWANNYVKETKPPLKPTNKKGLRSSLRKLLKKCENGGYDPNSRFCLECGTLPIEDLVAGSTLSE
jgi:hypothetical protein